MPQSIIERQQPKYWQGSIRWLTNTEKRKLRRQNTKDAGKWALSSIYNAITDLPSRLARVPAAWVDQIAWTDIQWAIEDLQSAPSQALRDSASNTKAFDKWSKVADAGIMAAALLWAWRMWWQTNRPILDKYQQMKKNQLNTYARAQDLDTSLWDPYWPRWNTIPAYQQKLYSEHQGVMNWKIMDDFIQPQVRRTSTTKWYYDLWWDTDVTHMNDMYRTRTPQEIQKMKSDIAESAAQDLWLEWPQTYESVKNYINNYLDKPNNTSKARAEKLKNSNRSRAERTLLKKTERDAEQAIDDVNNLSLEKMYNQWKNLNRQ